MKRIVRPELLDELPANDPRAIQSRRDLRRVNWFMGNVGIIQRNLEKTFARNPPRTLIEIGAGDGSFLLRLAERLASRWPNVEITFVDQQRLVSNETESAIKNLGWKINVICADVFEFLQTCHPVDGVIANLFLHHFENEKLSELLQLASQKTNVFVACEPRRYRWAVSGTKLLWLLGCNDVTRHDALVSVRAGFQGKELSQLWPQNGDWKIEENETGLFSHSFAAQRTS
jgi:hypothetical protein